MFQGKRLMLSRSQRVLGGVCGGLGEYFGVDPVLFRVIWIIFTVATAGVGILAYIACWLIMPDPERDDQNQITMHGP